MYNDVLFLAFSECKHSREKKYYALSLFTYSVIGFLNSFTCSWPLANEKTSLAPVQNYSFVGDSVKSRDCVYMYMHCIRTF